MSPGQTLGTGALRATMRAFALLGPSGCRRLARPLASLLWRTNTRRRQATLRNLDIAYPGLDPGDRDSLAHDSTHHYVTNILEAGIAWYWPEARITASFDPPSGLEHLDAARARGRGMILALPHLGAWELLGLYLRPHIDGGILFKPGRRASFDDLLTERRSRFGLTMLPASPPGLRRLYGHLQAGRTVAVLPDQEPSTGQGRFAPFFSLPALTGILIPRLVQATGARVVFAVGLRLPGGRYRAHFLPAEASLDAPDIDTALSGLNRGVEACIALDPAQYLWAYKRWRHQPAGQPAVY